MTRVRRPGAEAGAARAALVALLLITPAPTLRGQEHPHGRPAQRPAAADTAHRMEMEGMMMPGPLGIPQTREGSGTAWLPDFSPMYAAHGMAGRWELMLHGNAFVQYIDEGSDRGDEQFGSVNWFMGMARRPLAGGEILLRAMLSLEPITVGECGYPDLLATGEFCDDRGPLHDRQHPHDLFMELAAMYQGELSQNVGLQLYGALSGEPALGPVSYPHRISALANFFAPINHHWHDATHISFGVLTAGVFGRKWKLEASLFNGREPDDERFDLDLDALDSFSGRVWLLPGERWSLQVSTAHLNEVEQHEPGEPRTDLNRTTASVIYHAPVGSTGYWTSALVWGRNDEDGAPEPTDGFLLESTLNLRERDVVFARGEVVEKTADDLVLEDPALEDEMFTVGKLTLGYMREFGPFGSLLPGLGVSLSVSFVGDDLDPFYGTNVPLGFALFGNLKPARMEMHAAHATAAPAPPSPGAEPMPHPAGHDSLPGAPPHTMTGLLSLPEVERAVSAEGVHLTAGETVRHPFWSVPTAVYHLHGTRTPRAALQVNVYPTVEAAQADAARIGHDGSIGATRPTWLAPPHFFVARNVLITLLVDSGRDPGVVESIERAVRRLGGKGVTGPD